MERKEKPLVWLYGEIKSPPFSTNARIETGYLLRKLQQGHQLSLPQSRPLSIIGARCHELRISDENKIWRIIYYLDTEAVVILEVFNKKTNKTPKEIINSCKRRIQLYKSP